MNVRLPLTREDAKALIAGDLVLLSGEVYAARDAAHKRIAALVENGEALPFPLTNACIYYVGPCPAAPGEIIGPCGPTTSARMDAYTPSFIALGQTAAIGKGSRSAEVKKAMGQYGSVYFAVTGGAGMLIAQHVSACEPVAFGDLGPEAVFKLTFNDLPAIVAIDAHGGDLYERTT